MKVYLDMCCYNRPYDPQDQMSISTILKEQFDYTKWQREYYDAMEPGEFLKNAAEYAKRHPFEGQAMRVHAE